MQLNISAAGAGYANAFGNEAPNQGQDVADLLLARGKSLSGSSSGHFESPHFNRFQEVAITVVDASKHEQTFIFNERQTCLVGRAEDCDIRFPWNWIHRHISHHHCLLEIDPPYVSVRNLGSTNGTTVNGWKVEAKPFEVVIGQTHFTGLMLLNGDEIRIGPATIRVRVRDDSSEVELTGPTSEEIAKELLITD